MKIAFIGAGSIGFTREMLRDILSVPEFKEIKITFTDINKQNLDMAYQLCQRDIDYNKLNIQIKCYLDRKEALKNADYVFNFARIGMLEAFEIDVMIPLKYGIDQCVGDTLCAGGIMYGQRGIIALKEFCDDIKEVANKNCLLLNYGNPNAMLTWACNTYFGVNTIGLCHGVQNGHNLIAKAFNKEMDDILIKCVGINHQTWYTKIVDKKSKENLQPKLLETLLNDKEISETQKVRIDVLKHFGLFSTESNGHLSEYLPWYRKDVDRIHEFISLDTWINGESAGYYRECSERRDWFEKDFPKWLKEGPLNYSSYNDGLEHGSHIIEAIETNRIYRGHFNVINNDVVKNLAQDCVVEVPGYVDALGVHIPQVDNLPDGCASICTSSINVQRLAVKAALTGDIVLLRQAMLLDPLTSAVLYPDEIYQMVDEMLIAQEKWLPQYKDEIVKAKERLKKYYKEPNKKISKNTFIKRRSFEELEKDESSMSRFNKSAHNN